MKQTTVKEMMTTDVVTLDKQQAIPLAQELMRMLRIRHVPVVDGETGKIEGVVTHRGLLSAQVDMLTELTGDTDAEQELSIPVHKVMTTEVFSVTPETTVAEALSTLLGNQRGCLLVVQGDKIEGIVTSRDFLKFQLANMERRKEARAENGSPDAVAERAVAVAVSEIMQKIEPLLQAPPPAPPPVQVPAPASRAPLLTVVLVGIIAILAGLLLMRELTARPGGTEMAEVSAPDATSQQDPGAPGGQKAKPKAAAGRRADAGAGEKAGTQGGSKRRSWKTSTEPAAVLDQPEQSIEDQLASSLTGVDASSSVAGQQADAGLVGPLAPGPPSGQPSREAAARRDPRPRRPGWVPEPIGDYR